MAQDGMGEKQSKSRTVSFFTIPAHLMENDVAEVGIITLSADEELAAYKRANGDSARLANELAKTCIVEVVDTAGAAKKLSLADGSVDIFWKSLDPRVRQLVLGGYAELHAAKDEDARSFLKSRKIRVS
jgi:hypothetical protein